MPKNESDEKAERQLMELYEQRDQLKEAIRFATPDKVAAGQALLRDLEADIDSYESLIAPVQEASAKLDVALDERRQQMLDLLKKLDALEAEPTFPKAAREMIPSTRAETLHFLRLDATERGIPNDDH